MSAARNTPEGDLSRRQFARRSRPEVLGGGQCARVAVPARAGVGGGGLRADRLRPAADGQAAEPHRRRVVPALAPARHALAADREETAARSARPGRQDGPGSGPLRSARAASASQYRDWMTDPADLDSLLNWTNDKLGIHYRQGRGRFRALLVRSPRAARLAVRRTQQVHARRQGPPAAGALRARRRHDHRRRLLRLEGFRRQRSAARSRPCSPAGRSASSRPTTRSSRRTTSSATSPTRRPTARSTTPSPAWKASPSAAAPAWSTRRST